VRTFVVLFVAGLSSSLAAGQGSQPTQPSKTPSAVNMPDPVVINPAPFPVTPKWEPPANLGNAQPLGPPLEPVAEQAERTLWTWIISSTVGALAILAGVAARFIVRARANGDFSEDPWIKAQLQSGGKLPE
jgi:hypothetical protein